MSSKNGISISKFSTTVNFNIPKIYSDYIYVEDEIYSCEFWMHGRKIVRRCKICNKWIRRKNGAHNHVKTHYKIYTFIDETEKLKKYFEKKNAL